MSEHMTIDQILTASKNDIDNQIKRGLFKGMESANDNEENFFTIEALYCQWAKDKESAENNLWVMFEEEYPQYF